MHFSSAQNATYTQQQNQRWYTNRHDVYKNVCECFHHDITHPVQVNTANTVIIPNTRNIKNLNKQDKA